MDVWQWHVLPGPGGRSGRGGKCLAEWKMAVCKESVCTQLRLWQETVRVRLLLLHLSLPVIDLRFNFVNSTSPALVMEQHSSRRSTCFFSSGGANHEDVFDSKKGWMKSLACMKIFHNILKRSEYSVSFNEAYSCYCFTLHMWSADKAPVPMSNSTIFHPWALVLYCRADQWVYSNHRQLQTA